MALFSQSWHCRGWSGTASRHRRAAEREVRYLHTFCSHSSVVLGGGWGSVTRRWWSPGAICGLSHANNRRCWRTGYTREDRCARFPAPFSPDPGLTRIRVGLMEHRQLESLAEEGCQNSGACQAKEEGFFCRMPGQGHVIRREHQL